MEDTSEESNISHERANSLTKEQDQAYANKRRRERNARQRGKKKEDKKKYIHRSACENILPARYSNLINCRKASNIAGLPSPPLKLKPTAEGNKEVAGVQQDGHGKGK